ncbi:hypothetical protein KGO5_04243 [Sinorhizobium sp. KGO-5]|uniref:hypothetical protein n=1 Tax=Sinorhizobium sp. KGO-5 TaxID=1470810 RepID=UPI002949BBF2|nr:hypothetical protein KGO5_04243 [Sinorhizobium sp. KGO-5]
MADLTITPSDVVVSSNAVIEHGTAGTTVTAGQMVYKNTTTGKYELADNNSATAAVRQPRGIALNGAANGQPLAIQKSGDITLGSVLTAGTAYYLSDTAGGICPLADLATGEYYVLLGLAKSATVLSLDVQYPGVAVA